MVASGGAHEWHTREGEAKGSARYSATAAALAEAVYVGLFGVKLAGGVLDLDVRLLDRTGRIELQQPATQTRVAYRYRFEPAARRITLEAETNARTGRVRIVIPPGCAQRRLAAVRSALPSGSRRVAKTAPSRCPPARRRSASRYAW